MDRPQGGKASLKFVMLRGAEEANVGYIKINQNLENLSGITSGVLKKHLKTNNM